MKAMKAAKAKAAKATKAPKAMKAVKAMKTKYWTKYWTTNYEGWLLVEIGLTKIGVTEYWTKDPAAVEATMPSTASMAPTGGEGSQALSAPPAPMSPVARAHIPGGAHVPGPVPMTPTICGSLGRFLQPDRHHNAEAGVYAAPDTHAVPTPSAPAPPTPATANVSANTHTWATADGQQMAKRSWATAFGPWRLRSIGIDGSVVTEVWQSDELMARP